MRIAEYENRKMERFSLDLAGLLSVSGKAKEKKRELKTVDICAGGAFFSTSEPIPLGAEVSVNLILPLDRFKELKTKKALIKVNGKVIRREQNGLAVCFDSRYKISPLPH